MITDDYKERIDLLIKSRSPWLVIGLVGGIIASLIISNFKVLLIENIQLAFFVPVIVYLSDAVGTQTESVYIRNLARSKKQHFFIYLFKESIIGLFLGSVFGTVLGFFAYFWLGSLETAFAVGISMLINVTIAPVVALIVPELIFKEHGDPALGAGPFTTVIQDLISLSVYFIVAVAILF